MPANSSPDKCQTEEVCYCGVEGMSFPMLGYGLKQAAVLHAGVHLPLSLQVLRDILETFSVSFMF